MIEAIRQTPDWIWHPSRADRRETILVKSFSLAEPVYDAQLWIAATGKVDVYLNDEAIGAVPEHPSALAAYTRTPGFPEALAPGDYKLKLAVACLRPFPVSPVSIHLAERTVGFSAFAQGDGWWLSTDGEWEADGVPAAVVCKYGEEPYGDLENSPVWFIQGGYGDIRTEICREPLLLSSEGLAIDEREDSLHVSGAHRGQLPLRGPDREELLLFYHLRKQAEWKQQRAFQQEWDLGEWPQATIDLRREYNARLLVTNLADSACTVLWNGAESLEELEHYDSCVTEWFLVLPGDSAVTLPQGMRYVRLFLIGEEGGAIELKVRFEAACVPMQGAGDFSGDLPLLNDIYHISVHTNRICHQIGLWDGIKRDRLNWTYDFYMAGKADYVLWDDLEVLRRSIRELGAGTPYGHWMNSLETYTLWWINNLWEYFLFTADRAFILEMKEHLHKHVRWVEENLDADTGCFRGDSTYFIEWVPMNREDSVLGVQALLKMTLGNLLKLAAYVPELELKADWKLGQVSGEAFLQASSLVVPLLGIASGYVEEERARRFLIDYRLTDPVTPLSAYWLAECYSLFELHERAWETISTVWGGMVNNGATAFWESVRIGNHPDFHHALTTYTSYDSYRISLCHSWSSTPVQWISRFIMGVEPLEPGYAEYTVSPCPVPGLSRFRGAVPTPHGRIEIAWEQQEGGVYEVSVEAPEACLKIEQVTHF